MFMTSIDFAKSIMLKYQSPSVTYWAPFSLIYFRPEYSSGQNIEHEPDAYNLILNLLVRFNQSETTYDKSRISQNFIKNTLQMLFHSYSGRKSAEYTNLLLIVKNTFAEDNKNYRNDNIKFLNVIISQYNGRRQKSGSPVGMLDSLFGVNRFSNVANVRNFYGTPDVQSIYTINLYKRLQKNMSLGGFQNLQSFQFLVGSIANLDYRQFNRRNLTGFNNFAVHSVYTINLYKRLQKNMRLGSFQSLQIFRLLAADIANLNYRQFNRYNLNGFNNSDIQNIHTLNLHKRLRQDISFKGFQSFQEFQSFELLTNDIINSNYRQVNHSVFSEARRYSKKDTNIFSLFGEAFAENRYTKALYSSNNRTDLYYRHISSNHIPLSIFITRQARFENAVRKFKPANYFDRSAQDGGVLTRNRVMLITKRPLSRFDGINTVNKATNNVHSSINFLALGSFAAGITMPRDETGFGSYFESSSENRVLVGAKGASVQARAKNNSAQNRMLQFYKMFSSQLSFRDSFVKPLIRTHTIRNNEKFILNRYNAGQSYASYNTYENTRRNSFFLMKQASLLRAYIDFVYNKWSLITARPLSVGGLSIKNSLNVGKDRIHPNFALPREQGSHPGSEMYALSAPNYDLAVMNRLITEQLYAPVILSGIESTKGLRESRSIPFYTTFGAVRRLKADIARMTGRIAVRRNSESYMRREAFTFTEEDVVSGTSINTAFRDSATTVGRVLTSADAAFQMLTVHKANLTAKPEMPAGERTAARQRGSLEPVGLISRNAPAPADNGVSQSVKNDSETGVMEIITKKEIEKMIETKLEPVRKKMREDAEQHMNMGEIYGKLMENIEMEMKIERKRFR